MATAKTPVIPTPEPTPEYTNEDAAKDKMTEEYMRAFFDKEEKFSVKCAEDQWVQVNGYTFIIKKGERVNVPKSVFEILDTGGRI